MGCHSYRVVILASMEKDKDHRSRSSVQQKNHEPGIFLIAGIVPSVRAVLPSNPFSLLL